MIQKLPGLSRKLQHLLLLSAATAPVCAMGLLSAAKALFPLGMLLPAVYVLLGLPCLLTPGRWRVAAGVAGAALLGALGALVLPLRHTPALLPLPLMYMVMLVLSLPMGGWPQQKELPLPLQMTGVLTHVIAQIALNVSRRNGSMVFEAAAPLLLISFLVCAALIMLALNRSSMEAAAQSRRHVPLKMRRINTVLTLTLLALAVLIAAIPAIGEALDWLWDQAGRLILMVAAFVASLWPMRHESQGPAAPAEDVQPLWGEAAEPGMLAVILEKVFFALAAVVAVILILLFARMLMRRLRALLCYLWQKLSQFGAAASEDYEDEITDTRDDADHERLRPLQRLRTRIRADEKHMTPTQRVRYRYLRLKLKHPDWPGARTAREQLPPSAAALYEKARYSGQELTNEDAERFAADTRKV